MKGTDSMNVTNRYNPVKFLKDPKKELVIDSQINEENENAEDGSTGGNTVSGSFFQKNDGRKEYKPVGI